MRIFEDVNEFRRIVAYSGLSPDLMERHQVWCKTMTADELPIYLVLFLQTPQDIQTYKSNRLENKFCIAVILEKFRDEKWMIDFCKISYSQAYIDEIKSRYQLKM